MVVSTVRIASGWPDTTPRVSKHPLVLPTRHAATRHAATRDAAAGRTPVPCHDARLRSFCRAVAEVHTDDELVGLLTTDVVRVWSEPRSLWRRSRTRPVELVEWHLRWAPSAAGGAGLPVDRSCPVEDGIVFEPSEALDEWSRGWFVLRHRLYRLTWLGRGGPG